jgi:hypothetical protein
LLSGVAVTGLQDVIDNFHNANISKNNEHVTLLLLYINKRSLAPFARRLGRSGDVDMGAPFPVAADSSASHIACMVAKTPKRRKASNPLASALARWESEGGAPGPASEEPSRDKAVPLSEEEGRILQRLGAAVLLQWNDLPTAIQRQLFEHAVAMGEARHTAELKEQIARFLHTHKDDARASR